MGELDAELSFGRRIGECVAQGGAGGDAEFGEDLVEVGGYRSRGEEEPGGDLFVGVACRGEQGHRKAGQAARHHASTSALARSSHGRSSTTSSSGCSLAACCSRARTALATRSGAGGGPSPRPRATFRAWACRGVRWGSSA